MVKISYKAARVNAELTLEEAAKKLGVGMRTLWAWENGKSEPRTSQIAKMSSVYGIPAEYFFAATVHSN